MDIGEVPSLKEAMIYYPKVGGKRLRPVLAMVVGDAVSGVGEKTLPLGLALEITHNFTLVHDDLMDEDEIRRGIKSLSFKMIVCSGIHKRPCRGRLSTCEHCLLNRMDLSP